MTGQKEEVTKRGLQQALGVTLAAAALVIGLRYTRVFEFIELEIYDHLVHQRSSAKPSPHPIVFVELTEDEIDDLDFWDYPLADDHLAQVLNAICQCRPAAVGLDIYRSKPVPKDGSQLEALERVLARNDVIVMAKKFGVGNREIPSLEIVDDNQNRVGFADFPIDDGWNRGVRRGLFAMTDESGTPWYSLASLVTALYLREKEMGFVPHTGNPDIVSLGGIPLPKFRSLDGAYSRQDDAGYQFLMTFPRNHPYPAYSFHDVIDPDFPSDNLRGKIVLVGVTAVSVQDSAQTPLHFEHRGLDLHAQVIDQHLDMALAGKSATRVWPEWLEGALILLVILLAGALAFRLRRIEVMVLALLVLALLSILAGWGLFKAGIWIPMAAPVAGVLFSGVGVALIKVFDERRQTGLFRQLLNHTLNPVFAREVWKQRENLLKRGRIPGRRLKATVLMTDLAGFSEITARLDPEGLFDWLDEYLGMVAGVIADHKGAVKDFAGDAVHAVFGVPLVKDTEEEITADARRAVSSALSITRQLEILNRSFRERRLPEARMRVGITTGEMVAGSVGSEHLMRYEFIGETVNKAARLESVQLDGDGDASEICRIIVSQETWDRLGGTFDAKKIEGVELKGLEDRKFTVYRISAATSEDERKTQ